MTGGVLLQFPLYAGIFGVLIGSGLNEILAKVFVSISTQGTLPLIGGIYSAILGLFLPSGGGKWVVEAPYLLEAANQLHVDHGCGVLIATQTIIDFAGLGGSFYPKMIRTPPLASNGAAGLKKRLSAPGPLVTASAGIPGPPIPVGSPRLSSPVRSE